MEQHDAGVNASSCAVVSSRRNFTAARAVKMKPDASESEKTVDLKLIVHEIEQKINIAV